MAAETVEITKNAAETLRVEQTEFMGKRLLAVRVFTGRPGDPDARPTRKGLTLRPDTWRELLPAIRAALGEVSDNAQGVCASGEGAKEHLE